MTNHRTLLFYLRICRRLCAILSIVLFSCQNKLTDAAPGDTSFYVNFNNIQDRIWVGPAFWTIPMEDWQVKDGRLECRGDRPNMRANILTRTLDGEGDLSLSVRTGVLQKNGDAGSSVGFRIGIGDATDNDVRSLCYFGRGIDVGVHTNGYLFINEQQAPLPPEFDWNSFVIRLTAGQEKDSPAWLEVTLADEGGHDLVLRQEGIDTLQGLVALINNHSLSGAFAQGTQFWFDDLKMEGSLLKTQEDQTFGPVLWSMYTLSKGILKMTAQMPPLGAADEQRVQLQIQKEGAWKTVTEENIQPDARIAVFRLENWDDRQDHPYRLVYNEKSKDGLTTPFYYDGIIRRDPHDRPLKVGGLTCQNGYGFPYRPLVENLERQEPDLLFFSGDQIYEGNGGYPIIRFPADRAILNYLGKWYMFGWAFGDLMRNRPTICLPDDHEVYQGNLWGEGGRKVSLEEWTAMNDSGSGFVEPVEMVNVVTRTNCAHLPDPYDPNPMNGEFEVYYTDLLYGRVSFAIIADRFYKSGPERVAFWKEGRKDHIRQVFDPRRLERADLQFLGQRQNDFLANWVTDWRSADMKVVLSQTVFANAATHHGGDKMFLYGDMDSGGWPKTGRDQAIDLMRKAFAFHICGDQHVPMMIQYGIKDYRDAGWVFCTPAIATGYERRVWHDQVGEPVVERPDHGLPNTGCYTDFFGNPNYVYAVANPVDETRSENRYQMAQNRVSGFGIIICHTQERTITSQAFPFLAKETAPGTLEQFAGWPVTIHQMDNYGREAAVFLPEIQVSGLTDPVVEVTDQETGELVYAIRIKGAQWRPKVFAPGPYSVRIGSPDSDQWKVFTNLKAAEAENTTKLEVTF